MIWSMIYSVNDQTLMIKCSFYGMNLSIHIFNMETKLNPLMNIFTLLIAFTE